MSSNRPRHRGVRAVPLLVAAGSLAAATLAAGIHPAVAATSSDTVLPSQWPNNSGISLSLEGWPHAVRFAGADRYQTSLATALGLRGKGDFPFDTPDRSSAGATSLAAANDWWGVGTCPRSILIVSGGSPADSLVASALSDPTGKSSEPFLQRSAATDPLFDPVGGFARVDTDSAPVIVTQTAGGGVTGLSTPAHLAAQDLRAGGCRLAREAVIVGGVAAVPAGVEDELLSIGYEQVFRVAGSNRYDTAAKVAQSLGTAALPAGVGDCSDPVVNDGSARMSFVANAAVEYRSSATSCQLFSRTVVLAEGVTGADALAAGWWTSFWQVPVLLHDGSDKLPSQTAAALSTMNIDHIIVLGGTGRISEAIAVEAASLASAQVTRIAGIDRYDTSVEMARRLGGWWPTGKADEFESSMVCLAASSGSGSSSAGWPDALGAGPFCGALNGAASNPGMPARALAPVTGQAPLLTTAAPTRPAHDAVPVLLIPAGATTLPASVANFLSEAFEPADSWCTSVSAPPGCAFPGFAVAFGGSSVLPSGVLEQASSLVSGGTSAAVPSPMPTLPAPFLTALDMSPIFSQAGTGTDRVCVARAGASNARWLSVFNDAEATQSVASADLMLDGAYLHDADTVVRSRGVVAPACIAFAAGTLTSVTTRAISLAGRVSPVTSFPVASAFAFNMSSALSAASPTTSSGLASDLDTSLGGTTTRAYILPSPAQPVSAVSRDAAASVTGGSLSFTLTHGANITGQTGPDAFTATWSLITALGTVTGTASGEAVLSGSIWALRGRSVFTGGTWNVVSGIGGFSATLNTAVPGDAADDSVSVRVDGAVTG